MATARIAHTLRNSPPRDGSAFVATGSTDDGECLASSACWSQEVNQDQPLRSLLQPVPAAPPWRRPASSAQAAPRPPDPGATGILEAAQGTAQDHRARKIPAGPTITSSASPESGTLAGGGSGDHLGASQA